MTRHYITEAERYVLSFIAAGKFHAEDRQLYHDHVTPRLIRDIVGRLGADDAVELLQYIIDRVDIRYHRTKDRLRRYELKANGRKHIECRFTPNGVRLRRNDLPWLPKHGEHIIERVWALVSRCDRASPRAPRQGHCQGNLSQGAPLG